MSNQKEFLPTIAPLRSQIESILLVVDEPVNVHALADALQVPPAEVTQALEAMAAEYEQRGSGIQVVRAGQAWRLYTAKRNAQAVEKFLLGGSQTKLSRAALETLAVVAYRQPATRAQVSAVRGVNVDGVMRTLQLRGLIKEVEVEENATGAQYFATTELFLEHLGIDSLEQLPNLAPLLPEIDSIEHIMD